MRWERFIVRGNFLDFSSKISIIDFCVWYTYTTNRKKKILQTLRVILHFVKSPKVNLLLRYLLDSRVVENVLCAGGAYPLLDGRPVDMTKGPKGRRSVGEWGRKEPVCDRRTDRESIRFLCWRSPRDVEDTGEKETDVERRGSIFVIPYEGLET